MKQTLAEQVMEIVTNPALSDGQGGLHLSGVEAIMSLCVADTILPPVSIPKVHRALHLPTAEEIMTAHLDLTTPQHGVQVMINSRGTILWVNVDGICLLRICDIPRLAIDDARTTVRHSISRPT
jgi:hypothetical protein